MAGVTTAYQAGVHGSRPAASSGCILYSCSTHGLVYRSDGTSWTTWLTLPSGSVSAAPALTFGTSAAAGAATTFVATDATLPIFDATVPTTQAFSDAAAAGSAAFAARRDHKHGMPASPGGGSLSYQQAFLGADVAVTPANTFVDGPSVTLSTGTWLVIARASFLDPTGGQGILAIKLWDGTTVLAHDVVTDYSAASWLGGHLLHGVVVVASGTPTWKISAACPGTAIVMKASLSAATGNLSGNLGSNITAVKIA